MISTRPRFNLLPEGVYEFTVSSRPRLESKHGYDYYVFDLEAIDQDGTKFDYREFFFPNEDRFRQILLVLGGQKDKQGEIQIDETELLGMSFKGEVKHVVIKGKERAKIERVIRERLEEGPDREEPPF